MSLLLTIFQIILPINVIYVNDIVHSNESGKFCEVWYNEQFKQKHFMSQAVYLKKGDTVEPFSCANNAVGSVFLKFENHKEVDAHIANHDNNIKVIVE